MLVSSPSPAPCERVPRDLFVRISRCGHPSRDKNVVSLCNRLHELWSLDHNCFICTTVQSNHVARYWRRNKRSWRDLPSFVPRTRGTYTRYDHNHAHCTRTEYDATKNEWLCGIMEGFARSGCPGEGVCFCERSLFAAVA